MPQATALVEGAGWRHVVGKVHVTGDGGGVIFHEQRLAEANRESEREGGKYI